MAPHLRSAASVLPASHQDLDINDCTASTNLQILACLSINALGQPHCQDTDCYPGNTMNAR